jgi:signal transduction histidine kinase
MKPTSADAPRSDPASSLRTVGEALAATASLDHLARLIARQILDATNAHRVALLVRDEGGRLRAAGQAAHSEDGRAATRNVVALPLLVRAEVEGVVVVQGAADRAALDAFAPQASWAVAAVRSVQGERGDAAATRARIAGKMLHEVNNRLGAIQIYAYLLTERLRRAGDEAGLEVAGKLSAAVDRLATSMTAIAGAEAPASAARSGADLDAVVDGCLEAVAEELAARGQSVRRVPGGAGTVLVHEPSMGEALRLVLRTLGTMEGATLAVATERVSPQAAAIVVESAVGMRRLSDALLAGESDDLGRALVRDLVERQAGTVSMRESGEDGALVRIELGGTG